jgi:hypothetical protein
MSQNNIHNLTSLDRQIEVLKQQKLQMENQISKNWDYLKSDYGSMIRTTISKDMQTESRGSFFYWLFKVPEFQSTIGKTAEKLTIKLENLLVKLIDKIAD